MRYLVCLDPVPVSDGSCTSQGWVEQAGFADFLPTVEEANIVGMSFAFSLVTMAAVKRFFKPPRY